MKSAILSLFEKKRKLRSISYTDPSKAPGRRSSTMLKISSNDVSNLTGVQEPSKLIAKISGYSQFVIESENKPLHSIKYIRESIKQNSKIQFTLIPRDKVDAQHHLSHVCFFFSIFYSVHWLRMLTWSPGRSIKSIHQGQ